MPAGSVSKSIRRTLSKRVKGAADVVGTTVEVTRDMTSGALRGVKGSKDETQRVAGDAIDGAVRAGNEAGTDLGAVAKGAVIGAIQGVGEVTRVTAGTLSGAAAAAVRATSHVGGDVASVARKAVEGAVEAGKAANLKAEDAASAGAAGALGAASELGEAAANAVAKALSGTVSGVRIVLERPVRKPEILLGSPNRRDLDTLGQQLSNEGYRVHTATSRTEADRVLQAALGKISLALIDVSDFDQDMWGTCEQLRKAGIPFLIITDKRSPTIQRDSMKCGASGVLLKPLGVKEIVDHMHGLLGE